jgi:hypothetical protein
MGKNKKMLFTLFAVIAFNVFAMGVSFIKPFSNRGANTIFFLILGQISGLTLYYAIARIWRSY